MSNNEHLTAIKKRAGVWRTFFAPFAQNDNLWYTESFLDGKDAGELYADFNAIIEHAEALAAELAEAEARVERWKRYALAYESHEDALLYGSAADQENAREEARAARGALITSGDLPADRLHERGLVPGTQTVDAVIDHAAAMAQQLADVQEVCRNLSEAEREYEAEHGAMAARIERYDAALRAAASYIDLLDKGKGPSDPAYLPLRDCYRNAVEDLGDAQNDGSNGR